MQVTEYKHEDFEHVVLETPRADVIELPARDLEWLMRATLSTPYAEVIRDA